MIYIKNLLLVCSVSIMSITVQAQQNISSEDSRAFNKSEKLSELKVETRNNSTINSDKREIFSSEEKKGNNVIETERGKVEHGENPSIMRDPNKMTRRPEEY